MTRCTSCMDGRDQVHSPCRSRSKRSALPTSAFGWAPKRPTWRAYRATNPTGRVPALMLPDGTVMFESAAMLIHLALSHPKAALAPQPGSNRHAAFLQWMVFLSANVYEAVLRIYYSARYSTRGEADVEVIREQATADFCAYLGAHQPGARALRARRQLLERRSLPLHAGRLVPRQQGRTVQPPAKARGARENRGGAPCGGEGRGGPRAVAGSAGPWLSDHRRRRMRFSAGA